MDFATFFLQRVPFGQYNMYNSFDAGGKHVSAALTMGGI
jgi:hypothetical protein